MPNVPPNPFTLVNNTTADATQVMADLNNIINFINSFCAKVGINADITQLTALTTPLTIAQGGTGRTFLGQGTALITSSDGLTVDGVTSGTAGNVLTDTGTSWTSRPVGSPVVIPPGSIVAYGGPTVPSGWIFCNGGTLSTAAFPGLFAAIGTTYNLGGEESATFRVPDIRGRVLAMQDAGSGRLSFGEPGGFQGASANLGQAAGEIYHFITQAELPPTQLGVPSVPVSGGSVPGGGTATLLTSAPGDVQTHVFADTPSLLRTDVAVGGGALSGPVTSPTLTSSVGSGTPAHNIQPTLCVNYIIKT